MKHNLPTSCMKRVVRPFANSQLMNLCGKSAIVLGTGRKSIAAAVVVSCHQGTASGLT